MAAVALFLVGAVEYLLAAWWTQVVVAQRVGATAAVTFANVMLWGFVITTLDAQRPGLLVAHGVGCALGAGLGAWLPERRPAPSPRARRARRSPTRRRPRPR